MDFNKEEQQMKDLINQHQLKQPPHDMTKHYVAEVRKKINAETQPPVFGIQAFAFSFALVGALAVLFFLNNEFQKLATLWEPESRMTQEMAVDVAVTPQTQPPLSAAIQSDLDKDEPIVLKEAFESNSIIDLNQLVESIADDLFILEMLDEMEGLEDILPGNDNHFAYELDLFTQTAPTI